MLYIGGVFKHPEQGLIYITSGEYYGDYGRISNYWNWKPVKTNGSLGKSTGGYGGDWKEVKAVIKTKVKVK